MACEARTYSDGSWHCAKCGITGDRDESVEQYCKAGEGKSAEKDRKPSKR